MAINVASGSLTAIVGVIGILIGALISPYINHRLNLKYTRRDLIFKKRLEYFEKITDTIEKNQRMYHNTLAKIESSKNSKEIKKIVDELKQNRKHFLIMSSPLYFNIKNLSEKIIHFVAIEKEIFSRILEIKTFDKKKQKTVDELKENLERLNKKGNEIVFEMRKQLVK